MSPAYGIVSSKDGESFPIYEGVLAHERAHAKFSLETILPEIKLAVKTITSGDEDEIKRRLKSVLRKNASGDAEAANKATVDWFGVNGFQLEIINE